ncbi:hypothetical protein KL930_000292 [Ogataea haglerorum]|uniref:U2 small nuclear ribonucleoprotein A' n=1 Tax=Ogataea haglerorum TaxID=1937702 RepID=A0AAN6I0N7_9ASCO|nr:uncharacterized protein KL911_000839 [Ogataea haglerorum]KAG7697653.1 hypothetical protein KL951_002227 [Ogataea haglerorum]KAG7701254.1 hypothetical protein KL915_000285 [Ogataea haglerorum]KAG7706473.1 hypothetical protein KL950_003138 [Ogataea haglerorum]KAG7709212.1 hypothetical protein KL914_001602 [Ogataea haglerorum]KAG7717924.1 hypothetical protein KL913_002860 [Ogataea haglerorum]
MRLTPILIQEAPCFRNPAGEHVLSLRNLQIAFIESFNETDDVNEALDLTNNEIRTLSFNTRLRRIKTLLLARNQIVDIDANIAALLPRLNTLSLVENNISHLSNLLPLRHCRNLENIYLTGNPVTTSRYYKEFVVWLIPGLTVLDFERVKPRLKKSAEELLGTFDQPSKLALKLLDNKELEPLKEPSSIETQQSIRLTEEERSKLEADLMNATSLDEIERIELALKRGYIE